MRRISRRASFAALLAGALVAAITLLAAPLLAQTESAVYMFVADAESRPILDIKATDLTIKEAGGESTISRVVPAVWPMRLTVLVDNGPGTAESLMHLRNGLTRLFSGIPTDIPVSLIATSPQPRWLIRESSDRVQIANAIGRLTPDDALGKFSDSLREYAERLDIEFRNIGPEQMQPYLPVLVALTTSHADGSNVIRANIQKMLTQMRQRRVWTHMLTVTPTRAFNTPGVIDNMSSDEGQNAEIARLVKEVTGGTYSRLTGSGTSALPSKLMPELAQAIALRYLKQMFQHRVEFQRPDGVSGPMKNFSLGLRNHPGATVIVSTDGSMP